MGLGEFTYGMASQRGVCVNCVEAVNTLCIADCGVANRQVAVKDIAPESVPPLLALTFP